MGKSTYSPPPSEISGTTLAVKMQQKISLKLQNTSLYRPVFMGDSEIVLKMIAKNNPGGLATFYGTRIMEIFDLTFASNWGGVLVLSILRSADKIWFNTGEN